MKIKIAFGKKEIEAQLNDSETAKRIYEALPIEASANVWGEEIYFEIPASVEEEKAYSRQGMHVGELAYWPQGHAFCIFFGRTPASINSEPRAVSNVNVIGMLSNKIEAKLFKAVKDGDKIKIEKSG
ncbi:hypothetical protein HYT92_00160 [Candidatus Pacearchaeota archaeon]|nr:hypothetical protein [Candidatus Pacearchaeota archaeon]